MTRKNKRCVNCGNMGHINKECYYPNMSLGVILFSKDRNYVLMIQRKYSLNFWEFLYGKYDIKNKEYLYKMFSLMTPNERTMIQTHSFFELIQKVSGKDKSQNESQELEYKRKKFDTLQKGFHLQNTFLYSYVSIDVLLSETQPVNHDTEWEFPKGRPTTSESLYDTACREFEEETDYNKELLFVNSTKPLKEGFYGTNGNQYCNYYYVCTTQYDICLYSTYEKEDDIEVKQVKWVSVYDVYQHVKHSHQNKYSVFRRALRSLYEN
jgi:8-oxo-dGTP pyrophosphatase MutT (NUDIX family)